MSFRGNGYQYVWYDETFSQPPMIGPVEPNDEGVYVITNVQRKARQWRTNPQTSPVPFKTATHRFFHGTP